MEENKIRRNIIHNGREFIIQSSKNSNQDLWRNLIRVLVNPFKGWNCQFTVISN